MNPVISDFKLILCLVAYLAAYTFYLFFFSTAKAKYTKYKENLKGKKVCLAAKIFGFVLLGFTIAGIVMLILTVSGVVYGY